MTEYNKDTRTKNKIKRSNKPFVILLIIAVLLVALGVFSLVFAFKLYLDTNKKETSTEVLYETEIANTTPIKKEIPEEIINYEQPVDFPPTKLIDVPYINQKAKYPAACESISAVMALNFAGYAITPEDFIDNYLPKSPAPYIDESGRRLGYSPSQTFIGDPYSKNGWGCYYPVIKGCLNEIINRQTHSVVTLHNYSLSQLCSYIDNDIPVIIWATQGMNKTKKSQSWSLLDDEGEFTWVSPNHCLLLAGYDDTGYYFNDPLTHKNCRYPADIVEKRYTSMGKQALAIIKNPESTEQNDAAFN